MDLAIFRELLSPAGQRTLAAAAALEPTEARFLACFDKLRKHHPATLAKAALEIALLRVRGRAKFAAADRMYFTREALEQSSGDIVAKYRAARLAPFGVVADLCCGIGGDSLAFAASGLTVHAVELDPLRVAMATANAAALGLSGRITVHTADALTVPVPDVRAAFADPSRRAEGRRYLDPEDYTPSLSALRERFPPEFPLGVKVAPGVARDDLPSVGAEAEFISVAGEMKECVLWFGPLRSTRYRATVLPAGVTLFAEDEPPPLPTPEPVGEYVFDPDPAVVRAGLQGLLAEQLGLSPIDWTVTLLTGAELVPSPFLTPYRVEFSDRYHLGRLRDHLREKQVGRITMVKRGSMLDSDDVTKKLKLNGPEHRMVILTRANGEQAMIVGNRV
ncbi:MAG: SAM-dependent methyltransferase [Planctomycetaceae bacterium]|nr:SAM-dependent methyltransferase [Planctomycetaceae bacterium]